MIFGAFELFRGQRLLLRAGERMAIGTRAMDILIGLAERAGEVVTKRELMALAWPDTFVDEANLRMHVVALRKLLGQDASGSDYVVNIRGQGYLFTQHVERAENSKAQPRPGLEFSTLPIGPSRLFGRDDVVSGIASQTAARRLVSIVGPAGVGKSAVSLAVSRLVAAEGRHVTFVELATIEDPALLAATLAAQLDVSILVDDPILNLTQYLQAKSTLIVLDNCEHIVEAVAPLVEELLAASPDVGFLATSREPLLCDVEWVHRLQPLEGPTSGFALSAADALAFPAIQLFVDRARDSSDSFVFLDEDVPSVVDICARLDGLPLAIELVAARIELFGIRGLATVLGERLILAAKGSRTAQPRQQSIRGALDWSYALLSPVEQRTLERLSIFMGPFTLESAVALACVDGVSVESGLEALASLTAKSLVAVNTSKPVIHYRLLHVTRTYASEKLQEEGGHNSSARRHAEHIGDILFTAESRWQTTKRTDWLDLFGYIIDDVRAALDWTFSPDGDDILAARLTLASLSFGFQLSLIGENKRRIEKALEIVGSRDPVDTDAELRLICALAVLAMNSSIDAHEVDQIFSRLGRLAKQADLPKYRVAPLQARTIQCIEVGDLAASLAFSTDLSHCARETDDPLAILLADRVSAQVHHFLGAHAQAKALAERVIRHPAINIPLVYLPSQIDRQVSMRIVLARSLWIEGRADQASALMEECLALADPGGPLPKTFALALGAFPIALWRGDFAAARVYAEDLIGTARRYTLDRWERLGVCYAAVLDRREAPTGLPVGTFVLLGSEPATQMQRELLATCDPSLIDAGLAGRATAGLCGWANPEIRRLAGEMWLQSGTHGCEAAADAAFQAAITESRGQGALAWELRATMSLAAFRGRQGRPEEGILALTQTLESFSEGHETLDVRSSRRLIAHLQSSDGAMDMPLAHPIGG